MKVKYVNIVLVCLDGQFNRLICKELAEKLDMFFADLKAFIEYDLLDSRAILEKCGVDYLRQREFAATGSFAKFENAVLTADYDLFKQNRRAFSKKSLIVYLRLSKKSLPREEGINSIAFEGRDEYLTNNCDVIIQIKSKVKSRALKDVVAGLQEAL